MRSAWANEITVTFQAITRIFCTGQGSDGRLGTGNTRSASFLTQALGTRPVTQLALGADFVCYSTTQGEVYCELNLLNQGSAMKSQGVGEFRT